jgi:hypothetical protein
MGSFVLYAKTRSPHDNNAKATRLKDEGLGPSFLEINYNANYLKIEHR